MHRRVSYLWKEPGAPAGYKTAVSLHGHTSHSKESLFFISDLAREFRLLRWLVRREELRAKRKSDIRIDFLNSYWIPPVSPRAAYSLEAKQIREKLHLDALVSLTDHDTIEAPLLLRMLPESAQTPVSFEWSVPHDGTELHLGIHNLPPKHAHILAQQCTEYTACPHPAVLHDILVTLNKMRDVLIVLNHPMWDLFKVGQENHKKAVSHFLAIFGQYIHAFELGGLRGWEENQRTVDLATGWNLPIVAGGDRHGFEPSGCVNLTTAETFSEFVDEVRHGNSHVLFTPQYAQALPLRMLQVVAEAIKSYPDSPVGISWDNRVYHPNRDGVMAPLSELWDMPPTYMPAIFSAIRFLETAPMQRAFEAFGRPEERLRLTLTGEAS